MMARLKWCLDSLSTNQPKKNVVKVAPPLTKLSGSAYAGPTCTAEMGWELQALTYVFSLICFLYLLI